MDSENSRWSYFPQIFCTFQRVKSRCQHIGVFSLQFLDGFQRRGYIKSNDACRNYTKSAARPYTKLLPDAVAQAGGGGGRGKAGTVIWR